MIEEVIEDVIIWLDKQPNWMVKAVNLMLSNQRKLNDQELELLATDSFQEIKNVKYKKESIDQSRFKTHFGESGNKGVLQLKSISNVKGINNLKPRKPLNLLSDNLTIVYGRNGSGKSGYTRILKNACGARKNELLLSNIFVGVESQECEFEVSVDGIDSAIKWKPTDGKLESLSSIDIFDSSCGVSYVIDEKEVSYEPKLSRFLNHLADVSLKVQSKLSNKSLAFKKEFPTVPTGIIGTTTISIYRAVSSIADFAPLQRKRWTPQKEYTLADYTSRLSSSQNTEVISSLKNQISNRKLIIDQIELERNQLTNEVFKKIAQKKKSITAKELQVEKTQRILKGQRIAKVGTDLWQKMWEAARTYAETEIFQKENFPLGDGKICVLCQQDIKLKAQKRMVGLEKFVKNKFNSELRTIKDELKNLQSSVPPIWMEKSYQSQLASSNFDEVSKELILQEISILNTRKDEFLSIETSKDLTAFSKTSTINKLKRQTKDLETQCGNLEMARTTKGIEELKVKISELEAEKWIDTNKSQILQSLKDKQQYSIYQGAIQSCNTLPISTKQSSLAAKLITKKFLEKFKEELNLLGGDDVKVGIVKGKTHKGVVQYKITFDESVLTEKLENVLSEGEFRIVSLAAFLADVGSKPHNSPFIFDDPISSLDAEFEENVVKRIVDLSKTRQVIVFTHRISFVCLLRDRVNLEKVKCNHVSLISESWGKGEPSKPLVESLKTKSYLNNLINERLPQARKAFNNEGMEFYKPLAKALTSDFRILIEKIIEDDLINEVVQRYRRGIVTKDKLKDLSVITVEDTQMLESMMTKYSTFEHSQSRELVPKYPKPDELDGDLVNLQKWLTEFQERKKGS